MSKVGVPFACSLRLNSHLWIDTTCCCYPAACVQFLYGIPAGGWSSAELGRPYIIQLRESDMYQAALRFRTGEAMFSSAEH